MRIPSFCLFLALLTALGAAQAPSIEQSLSLKSASNPKISPDGKHVVYEVSETDWKENAFKTELHLADVTTGQSLQLTNSKKSSNAAAWSPDGSRIAFLSDRETKRQIWTISPAGGEAIRLTNTENGVSAFKWSPDGKSIAFSASEPDPKEDKKRKETYGDYEVVKSDYAMSHLWVMAVSTPDKPRRLTGDPDANVFTITGFSWSPDSRRIAFSAQHDPSPASSGSQDIYVIDAAGGKVRALVTTPGPDSNPIWSPDGKEIAFQTANGKEFYFYLNSRIAVVSAEGGSPRILSDSFDEDPNLVAWSADGIYFSAQQKTWSHLFCLNPSTGTIAKISAPDDRANSGFSFTADFRQIAVVSGWTGSYPEVYVASVHGGSGESAGAVRRLTAMRDQFKDFKLASRELVQWKSSDGTTIEGVLIKPPDFQAGKKYPLLVVIHGGPTGVDRTVPAADRSYPIELFAAKGALILRPNYRGSAGYGEKFRSLNVRNLGVGDYADVISGVDALIEQGLVDRERVGAMGWSQGGYISAFITCFSDRFKAVSVGAGISDWSTYYVNTDITPFTRQYLHATPWDDPEIYRKTSPITYVKNARTPTLIQHGELDKRVPIPNAYELRQALEDRGVTVRMVVYKGFGHGIDKPKQQREVMEENLKWFGKWIWGEQ
jgi:dipeptidyl aminopeptidase/acylaminoacyl peptidase